MKGNWLIGACCALFVAVIVTPTGAYEGVWKLATGKDAAAWVQAFGSIGAILGAWLIGHSQFAHERRMEFERRQRQKAADANAIAKRDRDAIDAIMYAADMAKRIQMAFEEQPFERERSSIDCKRWARNGEALLSYHACRDREWADLVLTLFSAQEQFSHVLDALRTFDRGMSQDGVAKACRDAYLGLSREIAHIEADKPYSPAFGPYVPKQMQAWPTWTRD